MGKVANTKMADTKNLTQASGIGKAAEVNRASSSFEQIFYLQRTIGNRAVQRLFKSGVIQAKLKIGEPNDIYEHEADRVAEQVMRMPEKESDSNNRMSDGISGSVTASVRLRRPASVVQRNGIPTGIALSEIKPFGHADLKNDELKKKYRTYIGATTLMKVTPAGNYKGHCVKEYLTEVANTCPPRFAELRKEPFCTESKCLDFDRYGSSGDPDTGKLVADGPDTFIDRHRTKHDESLLEGTGKDTCNVVCHQRYKFDRKNDLGSFYVIRNFKAGKYTPSGSKDTLHITTGDVKKVPASLEAPSREKFAKDIAPVVIQPKLTIGGLNDIYEQEADKAAEQVMRMTAKDSVYSEKSSFVPDNFVASLGPGQPLDRAARDFFEPRFGADFSGVRVHAEQRAAESASSVNALAYTLGHNMVFASGQYQPNTIQGKQLLAHELTHVVQQSINSPAGRLMSHGHGKHLPSVRHSFFGIARRTAEVSVPEEDPNSYLVFYDSAIKGERRLLLPAGTKAEVLNAKGEWREVRLIDGPEPNRKGMIKEKFLRMLPEGTAETTDKKPATGPTGLSGRAYTDIMHDDKYIDNNMKSISFYAAQLAIVHYNDGSDLRVGLVPEYVTSPIEGVDYRTPRSEHIPTVNSPAGTLEYIPRGKSAIMSAPDKMPIGELQKQLTRIITFAVEGSSKRIVPSQINTVTAPRLCEVLREAEADYVRNIDALAAGGVKVFEKLKLVVEIASFLPAGGGAAKAVEARAATKAAERAGEGVVASLAKKLSEVLAKGGAVDKIAAEGVVFAEVVVARKGASLAVEYTFIENVGRVAGQGRMMQIALEGAAVQAARAAGAAEAQVIVHMVTNPKWMAYLESLGYARILVNKIGKVGAEAIWIKVLPVGD